MSPSVVPLVEVMPPKSIKESVSGSSTIDIPRSADGRVNGLYRNTFQIPAEEYGQRWMCESVNSGIKRTSGDSLRSHKQNTLFAEAALKVAAYAFKV